MKIGWISLLLSTILMVPNDLFPASIKNIFDASRLLISIVAIFTSIFFLARNRFTLKRSCSLAIFCYLAFSVLAFLSGVYSDNPVATFGRGVEILAASLFFVALLSRLSPLNIVTLWKITFIFLHVILLHFILVSILMGIPMISLSDGVYLWSGYGARNSITALGSVLFFIYLNRLLLNKARRGNSVLYIIGMMGAIVFMYLSSSRTSIILVGVIVVPFLLWYHKARYLLMLVVPGALFLGFFAFDQILGFLIRGQTQEQLLSLTGRLDVWGAALELFFYAPYLGHGYYSSSMLAWSEFVQYGKTVSNLDNVFIEVLLGTGIFGFILISGFFILTLKYLYELLAYYRNEVISDPVAPEMCCIVIFTFCRSFLNPTVQSNHWNLYVFVLASFYIYLLRKGARLSSKSN